MDAQEHKELGNQAFAKEDFKSAIEHYTKAISLNPQDHVFFSNRSASYAGLKDWSKAASDAKECIRLNPQFVKGYYRLATAQLELEEFDLAQATIKQGLALDANNAQLLKVLRTIKQAKKASITPAYTRGGVLDSAVSQELRDLQIQHAQTAREYNAVQTLQSSTQRELKMNQITLGELEKNPSKGAYFRSIGKMFMKGTKNQILGHLNSSIEERQKQNTEYAQKLEYLEKKIKSQQQNIRELVSFKE